MKLRILKEDEAVASGDSGGMASMAIGDNVSVGSNAVNYGPNNPYFSNLKEYQAKEKRNKKRQYGSKNAGHRAPKRRSKKFNSNYD